MEVDVDVVVQVKVDVVVKVDVHVNAAGDVVVDVLAGVNGKRLWSGRLGESAVLGGLAACLVDVLGRLAAG